MELSPRILDTTALTGVTDSLAQSAFTNSPEDIRKTGSVALIHYNKEHERASVLAFGANDHPTQFQRKTVIDRQIHLPRTALDAALTTASPETPPTATRSQINPEQYTYTVPLTDTLCVEFAWNQQDSAPIATPTIPRETRHIDKLIAHAEPLKDLTPDQVADAIGLGYPHAATHAFIRWDWRKSTEAVRANEGKFRGMYSQKRTTIHDSLQAIFSDNSTLSVNNHGDGQTIYISHGNNPYDAAVRAAENQRIECALATITDTDPAIYAVGGLTYAITTENGGTDSLLPHMWGIPAVLEKAKTTTERHITLTHSW